MIVFLPLYINQHTYLKYKFEILLFNCICIIKGKSKILKIFRKNNIENKSYEISKLENMEVTGALWGKIFVKNKMKEEFFFDSSNYEDYYTTYKYLNECETVNFTNDIFYVSNRDNSKSTSKVRSIQKQIIALEIIQRIYNETKLKKNMQLLAFNTYSNNFVMYKQFLNPTKDTLELINKLESMKSIIKNVDKNKVSIKNKIKYYLTNIIICIGKRRIK